MTHLVDQKEISTFDFNTTEEIDLCHNSERQVLELEDRVHLYIPLTTEEVDALRKTENFEYTQYDHALRITILK